MNWLQRRTEESISNLSKDKFLSKRKCTWQSFKTCSKTQFGSKSLETWDKREFLFTQRRENLNLKWLLFRENLKVCKEKILWSLFKVWIRAKFQEGRQTRFLLNHQNFQWRLILLLKMSLWLVLSHLKKLSMFSSANQKRILAFLCSLTGLSNMTLLYPSYEK